MILLDLAQIEFRVIPGRVAQGVLLLLFGILTIFALEVSKRRPEKVKVRKIPAVEAIDEAIGRATEMGRPVFFSPGLGGIGALETLAALSILGDIARKTARYGIPIIVANRNYVVYMAAEGIVKQAYTMEGKADMYQPEFVRYIAGAQFAYAQGCLGIFQRERPAANFFLGYFYAESLELAEAGFNIGAIQVAGTTSTVQLPFFVAACDYVLLGEELYAAAAYVTRDPKIIGVLFAHDLGKYISFALLLIGIILITAGNKFLIDLLSK
ncbi:MAG: hypothetical protein NDF57_04375 [archaeon GBS-70-058]|nr:hypothetical protein [Candidatus Culexarchaeum nevadense]